MLECVGLPVVEGRPEVGVGVVQPSVVGVAADVAAGELVLGKVLAGVPPEGELVLGKVLAGVLPEGELVLGKVLAGVPPEGVVVAGVGIVPLPVV